MRFVERKNKKIIAILSFTIMTSLLFACGGQKEKEQSVPTDDEAVAAVESEFGIRGASVITSEDVRNKGKEYHDIDAVYTMESDRGLEFTVIRGCETDTLFGTGYYYRWLTDYSDLALEDYLKDHPLPNGIAYSEGPFGQGNYGASSYFGDKTKQIWFEFSSDEEFEDCLDELEPWLDKWLKSERKYLSDGKDPIIRVSAYREKDNEFDVIMLFRVFGYEKDSFHKIGEDGQTYKWDSFRKAMEAGYEARKELLKK